MMRRSLAGAAGFALLVACGPAPAPTPDAGPAAGAISATALRCQPSAQMAVEGRASPYDSTTINLGGGAQAKICYGRPSARDRTVFGQLVPMDRLWRTGANEPTIIHLSAPVRLGTLDVPAGSYSLYSIPGREQWTVIVNRSTTQWGHESQYTDAIQAQELGRIRVPAERAAEHVETFTIRPEGEPNAQHIVMEWETTRVRIPIRRM